MENKTKWNILVDFYEANMYSREEKIQRYWQNVFSEFFNYSRIMGEIDVFRNIQIGSTMRTIPDIVIKNNEQDLFVIELKQHSSDTGSEQLISYLKLLNLNIGLLINKKITILYIDNLNKGEQIKSTSIDFIHNSLDGELFIELFSKPFKSNKVIEFIEQKNKIDKNIQKIKNSLNSKYLVNLIQNDLENYYDEFEINEVLKELKLSVSFINKPIKLSSEIGKKTTIVKNMEIPQKIGQVVKNFFINAQYSNLLSPEILNNLCNRNYCRNKFNISKPVLKEVYDLSELDSFIKDENGYNRYYRNPILYYNNKPYVLSSQWLYRHTENFNNWVREIGGK